MEVEHERREHPRRECSGIAEVAPYKPGDRLNHLTFRMVPLKDLSAGGFSFWATLWPAFAELALRLTGTTDVMLAHIREAHRVGDRWLVHCQFICRLSE
jgi:hypothetical protein